MEDLTGKGDLPKPRPKSTEGAKPFQAKGKTLKQGYANDTWETRKTGCMVTVGKEGKDGMDRSIWGKFLRIGRFKQENKIISFTQISIICGAKAFLDHI